MNAACTCGARFMDAEDFRDHMPCPGTPEEQKIIELTKKLYESQKALSKSTDLLVAGEVLRQKYVVKFMDAFSILRDAAKGENVAQDAQNLLDRWKKEG